MCIRDSTCSVRSISAEKSTWPGVSSSVSVQPGRGRTACLEKLSLIHILLAIFERTYGAIRRRDVLPQMMLRSEDKREFLEALGPADDFLLVDGYNIIFAWDELKELSHTRCV